MIRVNTRARRLDGGKVSSVRAFRRSTRRSVDRSTGARRCEDARADFLLRVL